VQLVEEKGKQKTEANLKLLEHKGVIQVNKFWVQYVEMKQDGGKETQCPICLAYRWK